MNKPRCLNDINPGQHARVCEISATTNMRRRLLDIGLIKDTDVECVGRSPAGDPTAYLIRGAVIALRKEDCKDILIF